MRGEDEEDLCYVPTRIWTHSATRSPVILRILCTALFVLTTFCASIVAANMVFLNILGAFFIFPFIAKKKNADGLMEYISGWPLDFSAHFICRVCHGLGMWEVTVLGGRPNKCMSKEEWQTWVAQPRNTRVAIDGYTEVLLPKYENNHTEIPGGSIIMSNHMSNIDGFQIKAVLYPIVSKAVIKAAAIKAPCVGPLLWATRQCFVWGNKDKGVKDKFSTYKRCNDVIQNNVPVVCFPEGTRRMFGRMNPFKLGLIGAAVEYDWPVLVAAIHGSHRSWPPRELLVNCHPIYISFADYVILPRKGIDTAETLAAAIRNRMLDLFQNMPGYNPQIERPLLKSKDLKKIMELAKQRNEIRESFLN